MTERKNLILVAAVVIAALAGGATLWARAVGRLDPGQVGPVLAVVTLVLLAIVLGMTRRRPAASRN